MDKDELVRKLADRLKLDLQQSEDSLIPQLFVPKFLGLLRIRGIAFDNNCGNGCGAGCGNNCGNGCKESTGSSVLSASS